MTSIGLQKMTIAAGLRRMPLSHRTHILVCYGALLLMAAMMAWGADQGRPPLVPLVFVHGEDAATIRRVIGEVADGGNTGFVWESRPHPDYLGPKWWRDLSIA